MRCGGRIRFLQAWGGLVLAAAGCGQVVMQATAGPEFRVRMLASDPNGGGDAAIAPDGKSFVISSKRTGNLDLWRCWLADQRWEPLTTDPGDDFEAQWAPDGARLVFTSTRGGSKDIWVLGLRDGTLRQLTSSPDDEEYPCWSPDGTTIAFTGGPWQRRDLYAVSATGGPTRKLTSRSGFYGACSFYPDGQAIVYHAYDSGTGDLFSLHLGDGNERRLTSCAAWDYKATVAPDGGWIAFSRSEMSPIFPGRAAIWLLPSGPAAARPLLEGGDNDRWPTWDRSGDRLFFHRIVDRGRTVEVLDRKTGTVRTVVGPGQEPGQACFDPGATRVAYAAREGGRQVLRVLDLSTGKTRTLATGPGSARFPRWSPDGRRIAYAGNPNGRWDVCAVDLEGGEPVNWTASLQGVQNMDGLLDWSPDGTRVVFHADTKPFESDLFLVETTTGRVSRLTDDAWFDESPSWAPDGRGVIFMSTRGGDWSWGFFLLPIDGGAASSVVAPGWVEMNHPRVSGVRKTVFTLSDAKGIDHVAESGTDGKVERVAGATPGSRWPSPSADGRFLLYTTIEHRVEYWLAEGLRGAGSPLRGRTAAPRSPGDDLGLPRAGSAPGGQGLSTPPSTRSPVQYIHR